MLPLPYNKFDYVATKLARNNCFIFTYNNIAIQKKFKFIQGTSFSQENCCDCILQTKQKQKHLEEE